MNCISSKIHEKYITIVGYHDAKVKGKFKMFYVVLLSLLEAVYSTSVLEEKSKVVNLVGSTTLVQSSSSEKVGICPILSNSNVHVDLNILI